MTSDCIVCCVYVCGIVASELPLKWRPYWVALIWPRATHSSVKPSVRSHDLGNSEKFTLLQDLQCDITAAAEAAEVLHDLHAGSELIQSQIPVALGQPGHDQVALGTLSCCEAECVCSSTTTVRRCSELRTGKSNGTSAIWSEIQVGSRRSNEHPKVSSGGRTYWTQHKISNCSNLKLLYLVV